VTHNLEHELQIVNVDAPFGITVDSIESLSAFGLLLLSKSIILTIFVLGRENARDILSSYHRGSHLHYRILHIIYYRSDTCGSLHFPTAAFPLSLLPSYWILLEGEPLQILGEVPE
jgi:hypothetical protein